MSHPKPPTCRTTNWHDDNLAPARRGSLVIWFDPETQRQAAPTGKRGRQPVFSDAAIHSRRISQQSGGLLARRTA